MSKNYECFDDSEMIDNSNKDIIARRLMGDSPADDFVPKDRTYDSELVSNQEYVDSLPDLQNGPSSLILGANVPIQQVGIHHFRLPLTFAKKDGGTIKLETSVTGTVSLEAHKKGINMSRIMRSFYEFADDVFEYDQLETMLKSYKDKLNTFDSRIMMKISYPIKQKSLRSGNAGYQYYDVCFEGDLDKGGNFKKYIHFDFVYSSACPCSYELSQHAIKYRNKAVVPHSQRSVARISIKFNEDVWIEDIHKMCLSALQTETQVMVKREDEQAFAELNGTNLKFVEDASRLLFEQFDADKRIIDFKIIASHQESLHSHDAIAVIVKGVPDGFTSGVPREIYNSLIHIPR
jgi:GTP cyclohydrolase IB